VSANNPTKIKKISAQPVLDIGKSGMFDENGVTPTTALWQGPDILLFYSGWQLGNKARYYIFTGVAISKDAGESFERLSCVPILDRSDEEGFARSGVFAAKQGPLWKFWYSAGDDWANINGKPRASCSIKYQESSDFFSWQPQGKICFRPNTDREFSLTMPDVWQNNGLHCMIYSIRSADKGYRLGYAESENGINWLRKDDQIGIDISSSGWDSQMICFGKTIVTAHGTYLFYGGNNLGEDGFGVAILDKN
jgi:hypothetical protein